MRHKTPVAKDSEFVAKEKVLENKKIESVRREFFISHVI
jgi:hypothetical protein